MTPTPAAGRSDPVPTHRLPAGLLGFPQLSCHPCRQWLLTGRRVGAVQGLNAGRTGQRSAARTQVVHLALHRLDPASRDPLRAHPVSDGIDGRRQLSPGLLDLLLDLCWFWHAWWSPRYGENR